MSGIIQRPRSQTLKTEVLRVCKGHWYGYTDSCGYQGSEVSQFETQKGQSRGEEDNRILMVKVDINKEL